jgi:hypothetical protein
VPTRSASLSSRCAATTATSSLSSAKMSEKGDSLCGRAVVWTRPGCLGRREGAKRPAPGQGTPHPPQPSSLWGPVQPPLGVAVPGDLLSCPVFERLVATNERPQFCGGLQIGRGGGAWIRMMLPHTMLPPPLVTRHPTGGGPRDAAARSPVGWRRRCRYAFFPPPPLKAGLLFTLLHGHDPFVAAR